jgi:hypothetical protein
MPNQPDINYLVTISAPLSAVIPTPSFWLIGEMPKAVEDPKPRGTVGFNLVAILIVTALFGLGLAYAIDIVGRGEATAHQVEGTIARGIGGIELKIPTAFFRNDEDRKEGFADEIELVANLPLGASNHEVPIEVTLLPRSRARPSAILLDGVYLHQFENQQLSGPPGLVGKPLTAADGFEGETVWYDALSADPFVAKCLAPIIADEPTQCLRTVVYGNVAVVYRFREDVLVNWRQFDRAAEAWLAQMGIR